MKKLIFIIMISALCPLAGFCEIDYSQLGRKAGTTTKKAVVKTAKTVGDATVKTTTSTVNYIKKNYPKVHKSVSTTVKQAYKDARDFTIGFSSGFKDNPK